MRAITVRDRDVGVGSLTLTGMPTLTPRAASARSPSNSRERRAPA
ncbi:hypothetical protein ACFQX6_55970 [Streptosporangium lutulentum]